jgi:O-antigen ligase
VPVAAGVGPGVLDAAAGIAPGGNTAGGESPLFQARVRDIWQYLLRQRASFWLVNIYMFLEYVRPQSVYPALSVLPWSMIAIILCLVVLLSEGNGRRRWTIADTGMVVFTGVVLASCALAYDPGYALAFENISVYLSWLLVYFLITSIVNTEEKLFVFILAFLLYNLKMSQHVVKVWVGSGFGFSQWAAVGAPGWFHNTGELGIEMAMFLPISWLFYVALKERWPRVKRWVFLFFPFSALVAIAATSSRGCQLATVAVGLWLLGKSKYKFRGVILAVLTMGLLYLALPAEQKDRFREMGDDKTSQNRITLWKDGIEIIKANPVLGVGYKNWIPYYRRHYVVGGQLPHNIFVEVGAESGLLGLTAFLGLIGITFALNRRTRRVAKGLQERGKFLTSMAHGLDAALVGYLVSGFFVTVFYYPFFWINLAMTVALHDAARRRCADLGADVPPGLAVAGSARPRRSGR